MATTRYEVVYADGTERVKLLTPEDAERLEEQKAVKSVKKQSVGGTSRRRGNQGDDN